MFDFGFGVFWICFGFWILGVCSLFDGLKRGRLVFRFRILDFEFGFCMKLLLLHSDSGRRFAFLLASNILSALVGFQSSIARF